MKREEEIGAIYNLYVNDLFTYGSYLSFDREEIEDAIQDVFIKLSTDDKGLSNVSNIKFYLFKSLKNRLLDINRRKKTQIPLTSLDPTGEIPFAIQVNVEDILIGKEEQMRIRNDIEQMLSTLTDRQREIIYLRYVQEYDYEHISELLQISVHGCRKLVSKAMQSLRERFGGFVILLMLLP